MQVQLFQAWTDPKLRAPHELQGWHSVIACACAAGEGKGKEMGMPSCAKLRVRFGLFELRRDISMMPLQQRHTPNLNFAMSHPSSYTYADQVSG